jgi:hypothetical protein
VTPSISSTTPDAAEINMVERICVPVPNSAHR